MCTLKIRMWTDPRCSACWAMMWCGLAFCSSSSGQCTKRRQRSSRLADTPFEESSADEANQKKWELESTVATVSSTQTLRGWKRIVGYGEVRTDLQSRSLPCSPEHVCLWLRKSTVQVSTKNMSMLLRVFDRMNHQRSSDHIGPCKHQCRIGPCHPRQVTT